MKNIVFDVLRKIRLNSVFCMIVSSAFFFSPAVFAIDFGGIISNDSSLQSYGKDELKLDQKNSASFWLRTPFDKTGENYFAGELIILKPILKTKNIRMRWISTCWSWLLLKSSIL